jgi:hypothetical protein
VCVPILVSTHDGDHNGPDPAHANDDQGQPEAFAAFATTAIIPSGPAVPTMVVLDSLGAQPSSLLIWPSQFTASVYQGSELGPLPPSYLSEPPQLLMDYPMAAGGITVPPRFSKCALSSGGFPIIPRNPILQPEALYDHQASIHVDITQEPIPDYTPAAVTASPGVAMYSLPFDPTLGGYLVSGPPSSPSLVNRGVTPPSRTTYQTEGSGQSTSRPLGQTDQGSSNISASLGPIRGVRVDQQPRRHQCTTCNAEYALVSGLNRHVTEKHLPWMSCDFCGFQYPSGRKYLLTRHLNIDHNA